MYDDLGRLSKVIDGQGNVATYTYDAVGNLFSITRSLKTKGSRF
ncbi:MAG: RHS repeat domain-containing protein [Nitrospirota bacterium]